MTNDRFEVCWGMLRSPGVSGARDMAMCRTAARFQAGRMPAEGVGARRTWPRSARLSLGAWLGLIGAKKVSPMLRGAVLAQYSARSTGGWETEIEVPAALPREREGSPQPSDAEFPGEEGRCVDH